MTARSEPVLPSGLPTGDLAARLRDLALVSPESLTGTLGPEEAQRTLASMAEDLRVCLLDLRGYSQWVADCLRSGQLDRIEAGGRLADDWPDQAVMELRRQSEACRELAHLVESAAPLCALLRDIERRLV